MMPRIRSMLGKVRDETLPRERLGQERVAASPERRAAWKREWKTLMTRLQESLAVAQDRRERVLPAALIGAADDMRKRARADGVALRTPVAVARSVRAYRAAGPGRGLAAGQDIGSASVEPVTGQWGGPRPNSGRKPKALADLLAKARPTQRPRPTP